MREKDFALTRSTLMNIALHFQMYAGWDGFANAFKLYAPWQNFMLVLLDQAVSSRRSQQQREQIGSLVLRTQRDLITAVGETDYAGRNDCIRRVAAVWFICC